MERNSIKSLTAKESIWFSSCYIWTLGCPLPEKQLSSLARLPSLLLTPLLRQHCKEFQWNLKKFKQILRRADKGAHEYKKKQSY